MIEHSCQVFERKFIMEDSKIKKVEIIAIRDKVTNIYEASRYLYEVQKNKLSTAAILVRAIEGSSQAVLKNLQTLLNENAKTDAMTDEGQIALNEAYLSFDWMNRARLLVYADELKKGAKA